MQVFIQFCALCDHVNVATDCLPLNLFYLRERLKCQTVLLLPFGLLDIPFNVSKRVSPLYMFAVNMSVWFFLPFSFSEREWSAIESHIPVTRLLF